MIIYTLLDNGTYGEREMTAEELEAHEAATQQAKSVTMSRIESSLVEP